MASANREGMLLAQIETAAGVAQADAIAATEGIDVLWVGHFDLTNSLGIPGQFEHPEFLRALDRVLEVCAKHGKVAGMMASSVENGRALLNQGFRMLAYWGDVWIFGAALQAGIAGVREGAPGSGAAPER